MTKKEILDYIMSTPENTNRQVLQYLLDDISGEGGNIPLSEYECDFVNNTESDDIIINLDLADITEDDALVTVHFEGEEESSNLYLILDLNTHTGIAVAANGIVGSIADFYTVENNTFCDMEPWPPESPQPTESYNTWSYENNVNLSYNTYSYQYNGETVNGFITDRTHPISSFGDMQFLSYVKVETISEDSGMFTDITGVVIDGDFMPIENFYSNWNSGNIFKESSYQYVFVFKGEATATYGMCRLTWYGTELRGEK